MLREASLLRDVSFVRTVSFACDVPFVVECSLVDVMRWDTMIVETKAVTIAVRTATRIVPAVPERKEDSFLRPELVGSVDLSPSVSVESSPADTFSYKRLLLLKRMMLARADCREEGEALGYVGWT
jgi:hypothetical protein